MNNNVALLGQNTLKRSMSRVSNNANKVSTPKNVFEDKKSKSVSRATFTRPKSS